MSRCLGEVCRWKTAVAHKSSPALGSCLPRYDVSASAASDGSFLSFLDSLGILCIAAAHETFLWTGRTGTVWAYWNPTPMSRGLFVHLFCVLFTFSGRLGWPCGRLWPEGKPLMLALRMQKSTTTSSVGTGWSSHQSAWKMCEYFLTLPTHDSLRSLAHWMGTGAAGWDANLNLSIFQYTEAFTMMSLVSYQILSAGRAP